MTFVYAACENGHRIKAKETLAGQTHACPKCGTSVTIPRPVTSAPDQITDTGVMRILGDAPSLPSQPDPAALDANVRKCPRCNDEVSINASVCKSCQCYLEVAPDLLFRMRVAARQMMPPVG